MAMISTFPVFTYVFLVSTFVAKGITFFSHDLQPAEGRNCIADEHYLPTLFNVGIHYLLK